MVNKHKLTPQIRKARLKAIDWILSHSENIPDMDGYGPEVSLLRSSITVKKLHDRNSSDDNNLHNVLGYLENLVEESENKVVTFDRIYNVLCSSPYGMRKGIIPIYIAYVFRRVQDSIILTYKNKEIILDGEVLSRIEEEPESFSFYTEAGTKEKDDYLDFIITTFSENIGDSIINRCTYAVGALQKWFRSLPKFTREHTKYYGRMEKDKVEPEMLRFKKRLIK